MASCVPFVSYEAVKMFIPLPWQLF